jgi:AcrR family transcriptional regulator
VKEKDLMLNEQPSQPEKRVRLRREERRAVILQSAKRVFARSPYAEASMGDLARESEVTEPMLYKHFGSKKDLFLAVLAEGSTQFLATLRERLWGRAEQDILDALAHVVDEYRAAITADPETQRMYFQAVTQAGDPEIARCVSKHNRALYELIRQLVERAQERGFLDPAITVDTATWGYMSMILAIQYGLMLDLTGSVAQVQEEMSRIWLRGLLAPRR